MGYSQFIFSSLAARKSILIEGIGVVSVIRRGSSKGDRNSFREMPHYDLIVTHSAYDVSLKESVEGDYDEWLRSVTVVGDKWRELDVKGSFRLKINNDESHTIEVCDELSLTLNPFAAVALKPKRNYRGLLFFMAFVLLCGGGYGAYVLVYADRTVPTDKQQTKVAVVVPEPQKMEEILIAPIPIATDTIPAIVEDSVEVVAEPKEDANGFTEPVKGNGYLVVGSFRELTAARTDAKRIESYYEGLKVRTTKKPSGDFINYIFTTPIYQDALEAQKTLSDKFEKVKGIWVHYMR